MAQITSDGAFALRMDQINFNNLINRPAAEFSSSSLTINAGTSAYTLTGFDLARDGSGQIASGTITSYQEIRGGSLVFRLTGGVETSARDVFGARADERELLAGNDIGNGTTFDDYIAGYDGHDVIFGGPGGDTLMGGNGNDHLYGQSPNGGTDGADRIEAGAGSDYVQGNAGNDVLRGQDGSDRINGGAGNDLVEGGNQNDTVNGNMGDDRIYGDSGNDLLRGGQGADTVDGGSGNDVILGDLGDDHLIGGLGIDLITGGNGSDVFAFAFGSNDAGFNIAGSLANLTDIVADFADGVDRIGIGYVPLAIFYGAVSTGVAGAADLAQQLFNTNAGDKELAAIQVGGDTLIFWDADAGASLDSAVRLTGIQASAIGISDFI